MQNMPVSSQLRQSNLYYGLIIYFGFMIATSTWTLFSFSTFEGAQTIQFILICTYLAISIFIIIMLRTVNLKAIIVGASILTFHSITDLVLSLVTANELLNNIEKKFIENGKVTVNRNDIIAKIYFSIAFNFVTNGLAVYGLYKFHQKAKTVRVDDLNDEK
jgi:hypothetical protein